MYQRIYYVDKQTGTFADVCAAYGLAIILDGILERALGAHTARSVRILDKGSAYAIELSEPLREEWVGKCPFFAPIPFITTKKNVSKKPSNIPDIDYDREKQRNDEYRELQKTLSETMKGQSAGASEAQVDLQTKKPDIRWPVWAKINQMSAINAYNDAVVRWFENRHNAFPEQLRLILKIHETTPNRIDEVEADWKAKSKRGVFNSNKSRLNLLQVWNPSSGKGQNTSKANRLAMSNIDSFWLYEYVKMVGFYDCAVPRFVLGSQSGGSAPKDRKTFALAPVNLTLSTHREIFENFCSTLRSSSSIKLDILAALHYTDCFLQYSETAAQGDLAAEIFGSAPENFVAGLHVVFYKDLGNAKAVMNLSFINLPHWMRIHDKNDVDVYRKMIQEHVELVRSLRQELNELTTEGGEELALLTYYRDFLSAHNVTAFFEFTAAYAGYLMGAIERDKRWVRPLKQSNLEVLFMSSEPQLKPIIENGGFKEIARAIRQSTVSLQYMAKGAASKPLYDIRYGLGQELRRRANYSNEFVVALGDFLQSFNAENARVAEIAPERHWRKSVREDAITEVIRLIDQYGAPVVAHLLLAFGYASASKDDEPAGTTPTADSEATASQPL